MKYFLLAVLSANLLWTSALSGQSQKPQLSTDAKVVGPYSKDVSLSRGAAAIPAADPVFRPSIPFENFAHSVSLPKVSTVQGPVKVLKDQDSGLPIAIRSVGKKTLAVDPTLSPEAIAFQYLDDLKTTLQIQVPQSEFVVHKKKETTPGEVHLRMQQVYQGIPVFGSEVIVHIKNGQADFFNGRYYPTSRLDRLTPSLTAEAAIEIVKGDIGQVATLKELQANDFRLLPEQQQFQSRLVIYHPDNRVDQEYLAWQITAFPNITQRWEYFVDAQQGTILHRLLNSCQLFHDHNVSACPAMQKGIITNNSDYYPVEETFTSILGPVTANATDLQNINRLIHVYQSGSTYYMIDASRSMFQPGQSTFPNDPAGVIWTLDAGNTSPQNSNFDYDHVKSSNNTWSNRNSVSAHYNGGVAYEYFKQVHQRNSVNGSGGNIISLINVADDNGGPMDNAFWNGAAMFYGNGDQAFNAPLAKALDVAGHEMSHGVIQATANLTYEKQSGALNESFADIFGAMMDRDDWKIGEEVANSSVFPSGTMRDMQNPHNGGNSNNFYWQPKHLNEYVNLPNTPQGDFGGVHINSGISNYAYYLFATAVGKDKAEKVYYKALDDYLVASSQFVDLRIAVLKAAGDLYDQSVINAAASAFNQVGIIGDVGGDYETDIEENPGLEAILSANLNLNRLDIFYPDNTPSEQLTNTGQISRPSISDDGSFVVFVDDQKRLKGIGIDWVSDMVQEYFLEDPAQTIWRNIATSKDGSKVAVLYELTTNNEQRNREILVFDFTSQTSKTFELYNPTTSNDGTNTGDVKYADVLEWDNTGEYLLYDAFNELTGVNGNDISYWDIGLLRVWDNAARNFGNGVVTKIFTGLQENESIGNPTFSKNSPYIIAFDYFATDNSTGDVSYILYGANIETNDIKIIDDYIFKLSFPSYAPDDKQILYSDNNGQEIIIRQDLATDKISGAGNWQALVSNAAWAIWFANGQRDLVKVREPEALINLRLYPNPFVEAMVLEFVSDKSGVAEVELLDVLGRRVYGKEVSTRQGANQVSLTLPDVPVGTYLLRLSQEGTYATRQVVKME